MILLNYLSVMHFLHPAGINTESVPWFSSVKELDTVVQRYMMVCYREGGCRSKTRMKCDCEDPSPLFCNAQ